MSVSNAICFVFLYIMLLSLRNRSIDILPNSYYYYFSCLFSI